MTTLPGLPCASVGSPWSGRHREPPARDATQVQPVDNLAGPPWSYLSAPRIESAMIEVSHLSKKFSDTVAVDDVTFTVRPGLVTGFLGPNGAGKSTTMRMILGLDRPTGGWAHVQGRPYTELAPPSAPSAPCSTPGRSIHAAPRWRTCAPSGQPSARAPRRAREVLDLVGLRDQGRRRVGTFSLGMRQRLGIAAALIGDPGDHRPRRTDERARP